MTIACAILSYYYYYFILYVYSPLQSWEVNCHFSPPLPGFLSKWRHSIISGVLIPAARVRDEGGEVKEGRERGSIRGCVVRLVATMSVSLWSSVPSGKSHEVSVKTVHWNQEWEKPFICQLRSTFDQTLRPRAINYSTLPKCTVVNAKLTPASEKSWGRKEEERHCHHTCSQFIGLFRTGCCSSGWNKWLKDLKWWQKIYRWCPSVQSLYHSYLLGHLSLVLYSPLQGDRTPAISAKT